MRFSCILSGRWMGLALLAGWAAFSLLSAQEPSSQISKRGPGMKGPAHDHLKLPVPRTIDLTHVDPVPYAAALGKDPQRIFEFVRDHVAFEVYAGCLRGPRGTLLAMAGNSVDRAALAASLLEKSGHKVRFAHGTLSEALARELVTSMWAERPRPAPVKANEEPSPALKKAMDTLVPAIHRDYNLIRDHLKRADNLPAADAGPTLASLVKEAQPHYWVQMEKEGKWIDFDPSFADSAPGRNFAETKGVFNTLPEKMYHQVEVRIRLEEYAVLLKGNDSVKPQGRVILSFKARAADLSGNDLLLAHQPEHWKGPATDVTSAVSSAVKATGRIVPVVLSGQDKWVKGQPFRQKLPSATGLGGVGALLGGDGTRSATPVATAEWLEFEFLSPAGRKETVVREVFDVLGQAAPGEGKKSLPSDEIRTKVAAGDVDLSRQVLGLYFTTGRIARANLRQEVNDPFAEKGGATVLRPVLRRINACFAALSDELLARPGNPDKDFFRFYPDSPRLQIVDLNTHTGRLTLDLRRDQVRAVALQHPEALFQTRIFRGVVEGTLERVLVESLTAHSRTKDAWKPILSTSSLFERARAEGIATVLISGQRIGPLKELPKTTQARIQHTLAKGLWVLAPERSITLGKTQRSAWWQINPQTGETIAVTDDGLHGTVPTEQTIMISKKHGDTVDVAVVGGALFTDYVTVLAVNLTTYLRTIPLITVPGVWMIDFF